MVALRGGAVSYAEREAKATLPIAGENWKDYLIASWFGSRVEGLGVQMFRV
jgi:hypothetical protein